MAHRNMPQLSRKALHKPGKSMIAGISLRTWLAVFQQCLPTLLQRFVVLSKQLRGKKGHGQAKYTVRLRRELKPSHTKLVRRSGRSAPNTSASCVNKG